MHFIEMQCISFLFIAFSRCIAFIPPLHTFQHTSFYSFLLPAFIYTFVTERWLLLQVGVMDQQALPKC